MAIVDRVKNICLSPTTEWPVIAAESGSVGSLISGYVAPLAAIGAIAGLIGGSIIGRTIPFIGSYRVPLVAGVSLAVFTFVMAIVGVVILGVIINALAPSFGGEKNSGLGRYNGQWSMEEFTTVHWVSVQHAPVQYPF